MSGSKLDLVRRCYEHFNRTGQPLAAVMDPDIVWAAAREDPDAAPHHGPDEIAEYFAQWTDMINGLQSDALEEIEAGNRVFVWIRFTGRGAVSGVDVEMEQAQVWSFRGERVIQVEEYFDREEGLRAAGVESPTPIRSSPEASR